MIRFRWLWASFAGLCLVGLITCNVWLFFVRDSSALVLYRSELLLALGSNAFGGVAIYGFVKAHDTRADAIDGPRAAPDRSEPVSSGL